LIYGNVENDIRLAGEVGTGISSHDQNRHALPFDEWDDTKEFIGVTAVAENQDEILARDHPEVAMDGVDRIQSDRGGSGARKGGCDLMTDMPRFSDACDDDFTPVFQSLLH
jgi:hypothetical protein